MQEIQLELIIQNFRKKFENRVLCDPHYNKKHNINKTQKFINKLYPLTT